MLDRSWRSIFFTACLPAAVAGLACVAFSGGFALEDKNAPAPTVVDPGSDGGPPSDALALFNGKDLSEWQAESGGEARWLIQDGILTAAKENIITRKKFGDVQLHLEWSVPDEPQATGESRGNSGLKLHKVYEIQILDNYKQPSNPLGQAGSVYKQHAPLVNACRRPGEWQSYEIIFRAPRFQDGKLVRHGTFTVLHNGILVQDNAQIEGPTNSPKPADPAYEQPLLLQFHGSPVRFRNIWIRPLARQ